MDTSSSDFPGVRSDVPSRVRYDLGFLDCGAVAGSECPSRVNAGYVASAMSEEVRWQLTTSVEPFEIAIQKKAGGFFRGFSRVRLLPVSSVRPDSDANAGGAGGCRRDVSGGRAARYNLAGRGGC